MIDEEHAREQQPDKPTYRDLWWDQKATLWDIWEGGTQLDANELSIIWNHYPLPRARAELALREYNELFHTQYTLDQVDIPIMST
jgi:hypothetical protein